MPARDRIAPLAASATMLVCAPLLPAAPSSSAIRVPIFHAHGIRVLEREASVNRQSLPVRGDVQATAEPYDVFTSADMAVLDAVERVVAVDTYDYDSLLDYDDD